MASEMELLGLNEIESRIYKILMVSGQLSKGEIRNATKIKLEEGDQAISALIDKKLIRQVPGLGGRYAAMLPIGNLKNEIDESIKLIDELGNELQQASKGVISDLEKDFQDKLLEFNKEVDSKKLEIENDLSENADELAEKQGKSQFELNEKIKNQKNSNKENVEQLQQKIVESITKQKSGANDKFEEHKSQLKEETENIKQVFESLGSNLKDQLKNVDTTAIQEAGTKMDHNLSEFRKSVKSDMDTSKIAFDESLSNTETSIKTQIDSLQSIGAEYSKDVIDFGTEYTDKLSNLISKNKEIASGLQNKHKVIQNNVVESIKNLGANKLEEHKMVTSSIDELSENSKSLKIQTKELMSSKIQSIEEEVNGLVNKADDGFSNHLNRVKSEIDTSFNQEMENLSKIIETHLAAALDETKNKLKEFNTSLLEKIETINTGLSTDRKNLVDELNSSIKSSSSGLQEKINADITTQEEKEINLFTSMKSTLEEKNKAFVDEINQNTTKLEELTGEIDSNTDNIIKQFETFQIEKKEEITSIQTKHSESFKTNFADALELINTELNKEINNIKSQISENYSSIDKLLFSNANDIKIKISGEISDIKNNVEAIYKDSVKQMNSLVQSSSDSFKEMADTTNVGSLEKIETVQNDLNNLEDNLDQMINEFLKGIESNMNNVLEDLKNNLNQFMTETFESIDKQQNKTKSIGLDAVGKAEELIKSGSGSQIAAVQSSLNTYNNKYGEVTGKVVEPTSALAKILGGLAGEIDGTETPTIKTTHVVGKDAIFEYMRDLISRVKSKITVLVPSITMIDEEQILTLKRTVQVTIISYIDEIANKDWIEKLHSADANVTLRSIMTRGAGGNLPDFIGVEREGEEILIGTIDEGNNDYVAIASGSEYFVKILGNIVIADYARGKSKQINK